MPLSPLAAFSEDNAHSEAHSHLEGARVPLAVPLHGAVQLAFLGIRPTRQGAEAQQ